MKQVVLEKGEKIVKSKSMVTTEVDIDPMLLGLDDVSVMETDLAEFILQMDDWDEPSHIVFPSIHKIANRFVRFCEKLGYQGDNDPVNLARCARVMRKFFWKRRLALQVVISLLRIAAINLNTNEGNADLTISIPKTQIVLMGMERIVPTMREAEVLDNLLARSAVGQNLTTYVTFAGQKCG